MTNPLASAVEKNPCSSFVVQADAMDRVGDTDAALDVIFRRTDELMCSGKISELNDELRNISANEIGTDVLIGVLTATLPVKTRLPWRRNLFNATRRVLKKRGHYETGVLSGLS